MAGRRIVAIALGLFLVAGLLFAGFVGFFWATDVYWDYRRTQAMLRSPASIYLRDDASSSDVNAIRRLVLSNPHVASVTYVSKSQALERFTRQMGETTASYETNPLPASLDVKLKSGTTRREFLELMHSVGEHPAFARTIDPGPATEWWYRDQQPGHG